MLYARTSQQGNGWERATTQSTSRVNRRNDERWLLWGSRGRSSTVCFHARRTFGIPFGNNRAPARDPWSGPPLPGISTAWQAVPGSRGERPCAPLGEQQSSCSSLLQGTGREKRREKERESVGSGRQKGIEEQPPSPLPPRPLARAPPRSGGPCSPSQEQEPLAPRGARGLPYLDEETANHVEEPVLQSLVAVDPAAPSKSRSRGAQLSSGLSGPPPPHLASTPPPRVQDTEEQPTPPCRLAPSLRHQRSVVSGIRRVPLVAERVTMSGSNT